MNILPSDLKTEAFTKTINKIKNPRKLLKKIKTKKLAVNYLNC